MLGYPNLLIYWNIVVHNAEASITAKCTIASIHRLCLDVMIILSREDDTQFADTSPDRHSARSRRHILTRRGRWWYGRSTVTPLAFAVEHAEVVGEGRCDLRRELSQFGVGQGFTPPWCYGRRTARQHSPPFCYAPESGLPGQLTPHRRLWAPLSPRYKSVGWRRTGDDEGNHICGSHRLASTSSSGARRRGSPGRTRWRRVLSTWSRAKTNIE